MALFYSVFRTAAGWAGIVTGPQGVVRVVLPEASRAALERRFQAIGACAGPAGRTVSALQQYFDGRRVLFSCRLDLRAATPFQRAVWAVLRTIPRGQVRTYGQLAVALGCPGGARAVGNALARNPFPIVIPCHRAVRSDGSLGGYQGGAAMKRALLEMEGVQFDAQGRVLLKR